MKRTILILACFLWASLAFAQFTPVTASSCITDGSGAVMASGTFTAIGTDASGNPIAYRAGTGMQVITSPVARSITNGSLTTSLQLANPATSIPLHIPYKIVIQDGVTKKITTYNGVDITPNDVLVGGSYTEFNFCKMNTGLYVPTVPITSIVGPIGPPGIGTDSNCHTDGSGKLICTNVEAGSLAVGTTVHVADGDQPLSLKAFGAKCDGSLSGSTWTGTDDTIAIQSALTYACTTGSAKKIQLPVGACVFASTVSIPPTCAGVQFIGLNDAQQSGVNGASSKLVYTGNSIGIQQGLEATPYKQNISGIDCTADVCTATVSSTSGFAGGGSGTWVMVRGSTVTGANTEFVKLSAITSSTFTFTVTGAGTATGGAGGYVDYSHLQGWFGQGAQGTNFKDVRLVCGSSTTSLLNNKSYGSTHSYATDAVFLMDWRGGGIKTDNVTIANCAVGYWGITADQSNFRNLSLSSNKVGMRFDAHSNQNVINYLWSSFNDTTIDQNGSQELVIRDWTTDSEGSETTCVWNLHNDYPNQSAGESVAYGGRFENFNGEAGKLYQGYVCAGVSSPYPVDNVSLIDPTFVGDYYNIMPNTAFGVLAENADGIVIARPRAYAGSTAMGGIATALFGATGTGSPRAYIEQLYHAPHAWANKATSTGTPQAMLTYQHTDGSKRFANLFGTTAVDVRGANDVPGVGLQFTTGGVGQFYDYVNAIARHQIFTAATGPNVERLLAGGKFQIHDSANVRQFYVSEKGGFDLLRTTIANFAALTYMTIGEKVEATDGLSGSDCSAGGGSARALCECTAVTGSPATCSAWTPVAAPSTTTPVLTFFCVGTVGTGNGSTYYLLPGGSNTACSGGSLNAPRAPFAMTVTSCKVNAQVGGAAAGSGQVSLAKRTYSGTAGALTVSATSTPICTLGVGTGITQCENTGLSVSYAAGDGYGVQITTGQATDTTQGVTVTCTYR